jgi:hypothetical protein
VTGLFWTPGQPKLGNFEPGEYVGGPRGFNELSIIVELAMPPASKTEKKQRTWIVLKCILGNDRKKLSMIDLEKADESE